MAAAAAAALLDELMGRSRNLAPTEQSSEVRWDDDEVCKYFLCGFCPHELFVNTRADLGPCNKIHDDALRDHYVKSSRYERMGYEEDFVRFLQSMISDVEKRIRRGHQRLALNSAQGMVNGTNSSTAREEKINILTEKINELVKRVEELGCEGKVEDAQGVMKLCEQLREERTQLENKTGNSSEPEKTMEVCSVCGALLVVGDVQQRIDEHLLGKQHAGYAKIREYVEEQKQKRIRAEEEERAARDARIAREREERDRERQQERDREREREERRRREREEREREKEKERERERERERRHKRSRSRRSTSRGRHRSRSIERRGSRSRDNSRERRHKSSRHRRSRSRSGSRSHHSNSRDLEARHSENRDGRHSRDRRSGGEEERGDDRCGGEDRRSPGTASYRDGRDSGYDH